MNLLLFASEAGLRHIRPCDPRLPHVREVLRLRPGDRLYAGVLGGGRAWATILSDGPDGMFTEPQWEPQPPPQPLPLRLLVGLPRPQTARRILFEAAVFGVSQLDFFQAQKGEPSYAQSSLWHSPQWQERLWQGAEQACVTDLPQVRHFTSLEAALLEPDTACVAPKGKTAANSTPPANGKPAQVAVGAMPPPGGKSMQMPVDAAGSADGKCAEPATDTANSVSPQPARAAGNGIRLALDVYEAVAPLSHLLPSGIPQNRLLTLAIGAERGWSAQERTLLGEHDFLLTHIGQRVLRAETAFVCALSLATDKLLSD